MFLGLLYPDLLVRDTDPDPDPFIKLEKDGFLLFSLEEIYTQAISTNLISICVKINNIKRR